MLARQPIFGGSAHEDLAYRRAVLVWLKSQPGEDRACRYACDGTNVVCRGESCDVSHCRGRLCASAWNRRCSGYMHPSLYRFSAASVSGPLPRFLLIDFRNFLLFPVPFRASLGRTKRCTSLVVLRLTKRAEVGWSTLHRHRPESQRESPLVK